MTTMIACVIATISTATLFVMWFWLVLRELTIKNDTMQSAQSQLAACRKKHLLARGGPEEADTQAILTRSLDIYRQSVTLYNQTLHKPWNRIPGFLMGFRKIAKGEDE